MLQERAVHPDQSAQNETVQRQSSEALIGSVTQVDAKRNN